VASRLGAWVERRLPIAAWLRLGREEEIPGGSRFAYALGSATLFAFALQVVTGVWQLFYYAPTVDHAYASLLYLRTQVPFGWLLHGLHYWGANLMVVVLVCHLCRAFVWGAYKTPRELVWLTGVALFLLTMALSFTGAPLPWDERGYRAAEVGTSIAGSVPGVGPLAERVLLGGGAMGQLTLSRFFILHAAILPAALALAVLLHLAAFRRFGTTGPWKEAQRAASGPFWPDQVFKDAVVAAALFVLLVALSALRPAPIAGPADPLDASYVPRPEWNFLFLFEALRLLPGRLEALGTVGIPSLGILLLVGLPFLDRGPERDPARRPVAMAGGVAGLGAVIALTVAAARGPAAPAAPSAAAAPAASASQASAAPVGSASQTSAARGPTVVAGERLFRSLGCVGCHRAGGQGGTVGPDLSQEASRGRSREWLAQQIHDPAKHFPGGVMPAFAGLDAARTNALVDFLLSQGGGPAAALPALPAAPPAALPAPPPAAARAAASLPPPRAALAAPGPAASIVGSADHGAVLFARYCAACHGEGGRGGVPNPGAAAGVVPALAPVDPDLRDADPAVFAANLDRFVQHGADPAGAALEMPAFGDTTALTQAGLADVEAYVMRRNGVDRAAPLHPGVAPRRYAAAVGAAAAALAVALAVVGLALRARARGR
jgi:ubiquinol-cytochrome c reductase cytochrome b subunit